MVSGLLGGILQGLALYTGKMAGIELKNIFSPFRYPTKVNQPGKQPNRASPE